MLCDPMEAVGYSSSSGAAQEPRTHQICRYGMSRFLGEIRQAGYVVDDIEAAMDYWSRVLGIGPFFYKERVPIENYTYRGKSYEPHNSVALANSGPLQIELIQTRNDAPS